MSARKMITTTRPSPATAKRELRFSFILVSEANSFNDFTVPNQHSVLLLAGIGAEAVPGIDGEIDQPAVLVLPIFPEIGAFGLPLPLNLGTAWVDQIFLHPIPGDLLVKLWIRSA